MSYTNTWDDTTPLDTQAANQGAADFRNLKLDIMQRVASFGAGPIASRPTPETTGAGANWTGVMYWSTDTAQVFRWNGTSWDDITTLILVTSAVFLCDGVQHTMAINTALQTIYTATVAGNSLGNNGGIRGQIVMSLNASAGAAITAYLNFGSASFQIGQASSDSFIGVVNFLIINQNASGTQVVLFWSQSSGGASPVAFGGAVIDTTTNQTLSVTAQKTTGTDSGVFTACVFEKI